MEEKFNVYKDGLSYIISPKMQYLCAFRVRHGIRDYILGLSMANVGLNASFVTYLGNDWYKHDVSVDFADIVSKMNLPEWSKKVIHPLHMRVGNLYEIHDVRNRHIGTLNRGIYRLKDINDCVYYFSRIKGDKTIFQHDLLSEDKRMCKNRLFFEVHINKEVIDKW